MKNVFIVLAEAILVGVLLFGLVKSVEFGAGATGVSIPQWAVLVVSGILFHLIFEYTGLNKMYVDAYYKY